MHTTPGFVAERTETMGELFPLVYRELKAIAHRQLGSLPVHSLDTTGLVHETYLKMVDQDRSGIRDRAHFLAISAKAMRQILVSAARRRGRIKRGSGERPATLDDPADPRWNRSRSGWSGFEEMLSVHHALEHLEQIDPRLGELVECRFFAGMSIDETAIALDISPRTAQRDWTRAKVWLRRFLGRGVERSASPPTDA